MTTIAEQVNDVKTASASRLPAEVVAVFASDQAALAAGGVPAGAVAGGEELAPVAAARAARRDLDAGAAHRRRTRGDRLLPGRLVPLLQPDPAHLSARPPASAWRVLGAPGRDLARGPGRVTQHTGEGRSDLHRVERHGRPARLRARDHVRALRG